MDAKDDIILASLNNDIIRLNAKDISTQGRSTSGVKIKDIDKNTNKIVAVTKFIEEEV